MDIHVTLRDRETGQQGVSVHRGYDPDDSIVRFHWTEGNYCCDCNRSIFLLGRDVDDPLPCNNGDHDQRIELLKIVDETGRLIYQPGVLE